MDQQFVYLASASARRAELLTQIGVAFVVVPADIDETPQPDEAPAQYVMRMARSKADAVAARHADAPVLGADTSVVLDERIFGKPADEQDARAMLGHLGGRRHTVLTAVALHAGTSRRAALSSTRVTMRTLDDAEIQAYWRTGEPRGKAGSYAIQGRGGMFVEHIDGSYSGVVGLPLAETSMLLAAAGVALWPDGAARP